jgi:DNA-binding transcriptional regulator WhiA
MAPSDRDLVAGLRAELAAIAPARSCDRTAEAAGLVGGPPGRLGAVARLSLRLARATERAAPAGFDWTEAADHCRLAYLRGLFLARGSLSVAAARTHLEFVVDADEAPVLAARLSAMGLPASWRLRRGRGVVTWKSTEVVGTFLRLIGAGAALLELEARQVARSMRGDLNRVLNAESANLQRAVMAAGRQLAAIDQLEAEGRLGGQSHTVRLVAEARRETPESTLGELAERLNLTRSSVQRALERIEWLVLHPDDGDRRPWRRSSDRDGRAAGA